MMPVWIVLLPERTGIFTSLNKLQEIVEMGSLNFLYREQSLNFAKQRLFHHYSLEQLFLFNIECIDDIDVDCWYYLPETI